MIVPMYGKILTELYATKEFDYTFNGDLFNGVLPVTVATVQ